MLTWQEGPPDYRICQTLGGLTNLLPEADQSRNRSRRFHQLPNEPPKSDLHLLIHNAIEIKRQILIRCIRNDPHRRRYNSLCSTKPADHSGFHFHGVLACLQKESCFRLSGDSHLLCTMKRATMEL